VAADGLIEINLIDVGMQLVWFHKQSV